MAKQTQPPAKDTTLKPDECFVFDKNAVPTVANPTGHRTHEMIDGTAYKLHHHEATVVPIKHAVVFLRDPAFRVVDHTGEVMEPVKPADGSGAVRLGPGQVVAGLAELHDAALLKRARAVDPTVSRSVGREALIQIVLTAKAEDAAAAAAASATGDDGEGSLIDETGDED